MRLYNEQGLSAVSQRRITEDIGISPGNLTYHFKHKSHIVMALYDDFTLEISEEARRFLGEEITLERFLDFIEDWFVIVYKYRFIFMDLSYLTRNYEKISAQYKDFVKVRQSIFNKILDRLIEAGSVRKEEFEGEYDYVYKQLHMISDFYLSQVNVGAKKISKREQAQHREVFFHAIYPYFNKAGKAEILSHFKR